MGDSCGRGADHRAAHAKNGACCSIRRVDRSPRGGFCPMRGRPRLLSEDALLDAAAKALRRSGAKTTSEDIAREAGVSKGLLFCRYRTKGKLIAAVIDREARVAGDLLAKVDDPGQTPIGDSMVELGTQLLAILRRTVPFAELARSSRDSDELLRALACSRAAPQQLVQSCTSYFESQAARGDGAARAPR